MVTVIVLCCMDPGVNLYHHYCDYFNLYASQHINGSFSDDIYIVMWDTVSNVMYTLHHYDVMQCKWDTVSRMM